MFEIETFGSCLVWKLRWRWHGPPGSPSGYAPVIYSWVSRKAKHSLIKKFDNPIAKWCLKTFPKMWSIRQRCFNDNSGLMIFVSILSFRERNICLFPSSQSVAVTRAALLIHFQLFAIHLLHALTEGNIHILPMSVQDVHKTLLL